MKAWQADLNTPEVKARLRDGRQAALGEATQLVLAASQADVPVDKGDLKASGYARTNGDRGEVGYRDPVAVIVHENLRARHDDGHAKFLEQAMTSKTAEIRRVVAETLRKALGG